MTPVINRRRALGTLAFALALAAQPGQGAAEPPNAESNFLAKYCVSPASTAIPSGSEHQARLYYQDLSAKIALPIRDPQPGDSTSATTLDDVIRYMGFAPRGAAKPISATELQDSDPADLMNAASLAQRLGGVEVASGDVLVARFFAPKISDLSVPPVAQAGWRKLVRFRALTGSPAAAHQIRFAIVLFNFFAPVGARNPFVGADSANTQVILVGDDPRQTLYWLDFGKTSQGAKLSHELDAFFDAGHVPAQAAPQGGVGRYFVPCSCAACHGGLQLDFRQVPPAPDNHFHEAMLDYLDTDHWQERVSPTDDFDQLKAPVLFDPGTFGVIEQINSEILQQNIAAQPQSMSRRAAEHWLSWHLAHGEERDRLFGRSLSSSAATKWDPANPVDAELLPKLNRYCFRCHGTVAFDVFDKAMVKAERTKLMSVLRPRSPGVDPRVPMPPDRTLNNDELAHLKDLILNLK